MIAQESVTANSLAARSACDELSRRLRLGVACRAEEFLAADPSISSDTDGVLELIYTEFIVRSELGEQLDVQEWLERFPQWRSELSQLFEIHAVVEHGGTHKVGPCGTQIEGSAVPDQSASSSAEFVGGYELLDEVGRGGMGVVYRARQRGLQRVVALKMMQTPHNERERARFRAEAEATARLSHPNIVQIYEVGQEGDRPFLSMEFIAGKGLDHQLFKSTLAPRAAAELLLTLARAVAYAHGQGIVHRDLKPANVMLATDGTPKITDFGLARQLFSADSSTPSPSNSPPSIAIVGTPGYMAPEQCRPGSHVGPSADVYALGAILYETLTGRPPFHGQTAAEIWEMVRSREPVAPHHLAPKTPRDLETICLKCLAKQPEQRYSTAAALADDLQRFLAGVPILARPVGRAERAVRWCRRNPVIATLTAGIALTLICGTVASTSLAIWALSEKDRAAENAHQAGLSAQQEQAARELAEYRFIQAEKAVEEYLDIENNELLKQADFLALRKQLLTSAVPFYEDFVHAKPGDANLEAKRGRAYGRLAVLRRQLGEYEQAVADTQQKKAIFQKLVSEFPDVPEYREQQALSHHSLAYLLRSLGKHDQAMSEIRQAVALQQELVARFRAALAYRQELLESRTTFGLLLADSGDHAAAKQEYESVLSLEQVLHDEFPGKPAYRRDMASTHHNLANTLSALGKPAEALSELNQALAITEALAAEFPKAITYRRDLGVHHSVLAGLHARLQNWPEAEAAYRRAIALAQSLADDFRTAPDYRLDLATQHYSLGRFLRDRKRLVEAEIEYRESLGLRIRLNGEVSGVPEYRADLAESHAGLGSVLDAEGKRPEAIIELRQAIELWTSLFNEFPDLREHRHSFASNANSLALLLRQDGRLGEARPMHELAIETCLTLLETAPTSRTYENSLSGYYRELCRTLLNQKDHAALADAANRMALVQPNRPFSPELAARYLGCCVPLVEQDMRLSEADRQSLAQSYADRAMDHLREAVRRGYKDVRTLKKSDAIAPLRERSDFKQLMQEFAQQQSTNKVKTP